MSGDRRPWLRLALLVTLLAGGVLVVRLTPLGDHLSREGVRSAVEALRGSTWAPVVFVAAYATATALAIPGTILTLAGGALFGFGWGTLWNWLAANLGASAAFWIARALGRDAVARVTGDRLARLDRATRAHGFRGLLALRLIPLVPFNALNFGSGLTGMPWRTYAAATAVGILPGTAVYTFFADALLAGSTEASREALVRMLVAGALLLALSFLPTLLKKMGVQLPGRSAAVLLVLTPLALLAAACGDRDADEAPPSAVATPLDTLPDHDAFTAVLREVVEPPLVDYAGLVEREAQLDAYLQRLAATDPAALARASEDERLAFWINAYNACMLDLVSDHYPIERGGGILQRLRNRATDRPANSVWQIDDVFTREHCVVAGEPRSQDGIEHGIIRPMGDPRIHFVVNCAARSCPSLAAEAYRAEDLDERLDAAVRRFVADERHFRLEEGALRLNRVLEWYQDDFGGVEGLRRFLAPYLEPDDSARVADPATEVGFLDYDWTLNDVEER